MMIPYARQSISEDDIAAVTRVLRSDFLTQGPEVSAFEAEMAETVGAGYGVALSSATAGLHLACLALGLKPGDWLWTSPITFVASANCARYCGAHVDFVDIDPRTYNLCPVALASRLEEGEKTGRLPKIVVAVHLAGQSCEMEKIHALGRRYGFRIIEDAAHAVGADYQGRPVGACMYSDCTVFSFHPVKIMTTGEGGMVLTQDGELAARIRRMSTHGITRQADLLTQNDGPWYYEQLELGYHYRLTDIQAALGRSQLKRLPDFIRRRRELARRYATLLEDLASPQGGDITLPWQHPDTTSSWHLYILRLKGLADDTGISNHDAERERRLKVFQALRAAGLGVNLHYIPVYRQPDFASSQPYSFCPAAEDYYRQAFTIPLYFGLSDDQQDQVCDILRSVLAVRTS